MKYHDDDYQLFPATRVAQAAPASPQAAGAALRKALQLAVQLILVEQ
jgi:hypothetical protein